MLNMLDEFTHECLTIRIARTLRAIDVIDVLSDLFILRGLPGHIRSDNGPEFVAMKTLFEERGSHSPVFLAEIFDLKPLRGWWERHQAGEDLNRFLWALLVLESWGQQFIAGTNTGAAA